MGLFSKLRWVTAYSGNDSDVYFHLQKILSSANIKYRAKYYDRFSAKLLKRSLFENGYYARRPAEDYMDTNSSYPENGYVVEIRRGDIAQVKELVESGKDKN